jgi:hypothetical protein
VMTRNLSILQLRATHIKLLIAICVIGHFQQIRMCCIRVLCSPVMALGEAARVTVRHDWW